MPALDSLHSQFFSLLRSKKINLVEGLRQRINLTLKTFESLSEGPDKQQLIELHRSQSIKELNAAVHDVKEHSLLRIVLKNFFDLAKDLMKTKDWSEFSPQYILQKLREGIVEETDPGEFGEGLIDGENLQRQEQQSLVEVPPSAENAFLVA